MAQGHSASGMASFSRISTGVVCMLSPITTMLLLSFVYPLRAFFELKDDIQSSREIAIEFRSMVVDDNSDSKFSSSSKFSSIDCESGADRS